MASTADMAARAPATLLKTYAAAPETERGHGIHLSATSRGNKFAYCNGRTVFVREFKDPSEVKMYSEHPTKVNVAVFSPNGRYVASGDNNGDLKIWEILENPDRFNTRNTFPINTAILDICWSPDSKRICVVGKSEGNTYAKVILVDSGNSVGNITGHDGNLLSCDYRQQRPYRCVTSGEDRALVFHQGPPFKFLQSYKEHTNFVNCVRFSPDGSQCVSVASDGKMHLFDGKSGEHQAEIKQKRKTGHKGTIYSAAWSADGKQILTASADKTAKLWNVEDKKLVTTYTFAEDVKRPVLRDMQVTALWHGDIKMTVSLSGSINLLDDAKADTPQTLHGAQSNIKSLVVDRANQVAYTGEVNGNITAWDLKTNTGKWFKGKLIPSCVAGLTLTNGALTAYTFDDKLRSHDIKNGQFADDKKTAPVAIGGNPKCVTSANTDPSVAVVVLSQCKIVLLKDNAVATTVDIKYDALAVEFSPDDTKLYVGGKNKAAKVYNVDIAAGTIVDSNDEWKADDWVVDICASPDGKNIVVVDKKKTIHFYDVEAKRKKNPMDPLRYHNAIPRAGAWSPDGSKFASAANDSNIIVWYNGGFEGKRLKFEAHTQAISHISWTDNTTILSVGEERVLRKWAVPADYVE